MGGERLACNEVFIALLHQNFFRPGQWVLLFLHRSNICRLAEVVRVKRIALFCFFPVFAMGITVVKSSFVEIVFGKIFYSHPGFIRVILYPFFDTSMNTL